MRLIPSGVSSKAQAITSAIGNPITISRTTRRIAHVGISKSGKTCVATWTKEPTDDRISHRDLVDIAPLQLGKEVVDLHFVARTEFARRNNFSGERFKTRIAAQWIEQRINSDIAYVRTGAILITLFKPVESLLFLAQSDINKGKAVGCDISLLESFFS